VKSKRAIHLRRFRRRRYYLQLGYFEHSWRVYELFADDFREVASGI